MQKLTKKQNKVFQYVNLVLKAEKRQPTFREIQKYFEYKSITSVRNHMLGLQRKGYIKMSGKSRGLEILKEV